MCRNDQPDVFRWSRWGSIICSRGWQGNAFFLFIVSSHVSAFLLLFERWFFLLESSTQTNFLQIPIRRVISPIQCMSRCMPVHPILEWQSVAVVSIAPRQKRKKVFCSTTKTSYAPRICFETMTNDMATSHCSWTTWQIINEYKNITTAGMIYSNAHRKHFFRWTTGS